MKWAFGLIFVGLLYLFYRWYTEAGSGMTVAAAPSDGGATVGESTAFVDALAAAIAKAEGANPTINNPGDLTAGDVHSANIVGTFNAAGVVIIDTLENGWTFLKNKLERVMGGKSDVYNPNMTIGEFAQVYTGGDNASGWATVVSSELGVSVDTTLAQAAQQYGG